VSSSEKEPDRFEKKRSGLNCNELRFLLKLANHNNFSIDHIKYVPLALLIQSDVLKQFIQQQIGHHLIKLPWNAASEYDLKRGCIITMSVSKAKGEGQC